VEEPLNKTVQVPISAVSANEASPATSKEETDSPVASKAPAGSGTEEELIAEPRDLWQEAFTKLQDSNPDVAHRLSTAPNHSGRKVVDDIIQQVNDVKEKYAQKGWKYTRVKNGQKVEVNIGEVAFKMLDGLVKFKNLVDAGLKFDPTGYGE